MPGELPPQQNAAIRLPASLFEMITDRDNVSVFFALYDTPVLFPVNGGNSISSDGSVQTEVGSGILAATVGPDINFQNLAEPITIVLRLQVTNSEGRVRELTIKPNSITTVHGWFCMSTVCVVALDIIIHCM